MREVPSLPVRSSSRVPQVGPAPPVDWSGAAFLLLLALSITIEFAVGWGLLWLVR